MKLYGLSNRAYLQYQLNTQGNRDISRKLARIKLSRNIALGKVVAENEKHVVYRYGYLNIGVLKNADIVVDVHQEFMIEAYEPDRDGYEFLNDLYSIPSDKETEV